MTNEDKVVLATVKNEQLTVLWFHPAKEILAISSMPKANEHPELAMMKRALHKDHYLLGTKHADISMDTIIGQQFACNLHTATLTYWLIRYRDRLRYIHLVFGANFEKGGGLAQMAVHSCNAVNYRTSRCPLWSSFMAP